MDGLMSDFTMRGGALVHRLSNIAPSVVIGRNSRIDAFVTITGNVTIGHHTHIATGCMIFGGGGVTIGDYVGLSGGTKVYSATEDVCGDWITNPTVPDEYRNPHIAHIRIGDHSVMGAGSVIFPGADFEEGAYLGSLSMCRGKIPEWTIYAGIPAVYKKDRARGALKLAKEFEAK